MRTTVAISLALLLGAADVVGAQPANPEDTAVPLLEAGKSFVEEARISGFAQVDYLRLQHSLDELGDGGREPLNEDRFTVRHARFRLDRDWKHVGLTSITEVFGDAGGDAGDAGIRPVAFDLHVGLPGYRGAPEPLVRLHAGLIRVPFGYESYEEEDPQRFFGERSLFTYGLIPGRFDVGASLSGHILGIDWVVAAQNGEPLEAGEFTYQDPNAAKDFAGRVRVSGELLPGLRAAFASSALYGKGFSSGTPPSKDSFEWRDLNEDGRVLVSELIPIPGSAGRASQNFDRWGLGADVQVWTDIPRLGELFVYGEVALAVNLDRAVAVADPVLLGRDQRSLGFYVAAVQELTKHASLGVRFEQYEPNADALELFDGMTVVTRRRFRTLTTGLAGHIHLGGGARARILAEYEAQKNSLGRDNQGRPAQLDNDTLRIRMELRF